MPSKEAPSVPVAHERFGSGLLSLGVRDFEDATGIDGLVQWGVADYLVIFGALAAFSWVGVARLVRGQVISLKATPFIDATLVMGSP